MTARSAGAKDSTNSAVVSSSKASSLSGIPARRTALATRMGYWPWPAIKATGFFGSKSAGRNWEDTDQGKTEIPSAGKTERADGRIYAVERATVPVFPAASLRLGPVIFFIAAVVAVI